MATKTKATSRRSHRLDIYGADLHLATTKAEWRTLTRRIPDLDNEPPEAAGLVWFATLVPDGPGLHIPTLVIWLDLDNHSSVSDLVDTIAHEASHAAGGLLEHVGHSFTGSDEPHAYLIGWLARWMWDTAVAHRAAELT